MNTKRSIYAWPTQRWITRSRDDERGRRIASGQIDVRSNNKYPVGAEYAVEVTQMDYNKAGELVSRSAKTYYYNDEDRALKHYYELRRALFKLFPDKPFYERTR